MTSPSISTQNLSPPRHIAQIILDAATRTGVDFDYLLDQARLESSFRPDAKAATSSASGLYQFTAGTWLATVREHGAKHGLGWAAAAISPRGQVADPGQRAAILALRNDPATAALMAAEHASDNRAALIQGTGRTPQDVDLYLAHFLGSAGAVKFLNNWNANPDQATATLFPDAAAANKTVFFDKQNRPRSLDEIRQRFAAKLSSDNGPTLVRRTFREALSTSNRPLEMQAISPMPKALSIDFAHNAYRRLESVRA
jgi:hypothetical protein